MAKEASIIRRYEREQDHFTIYNKIESMGKLSLGLDKNQRTLQKAIQSSDILDEMISSCILGLGK